MKNLKSTFQVIYLNGPSSVGKSTLARALQEILDPYFLHIGIDRIIGMMPLKTNHWKGTNESKEGFYWKEGQDSMGNKMLMLQQGAFANMVVNTYRSLVLTLLNEGHAVIIDDVAFGEEEVAKWQEALASYNVLWIALSAPIEILEQREKERQRPIGSTRAQYLQVHQGVQYDLIFDTSETSTPEIANAIKKHIFESIK